MITQLDLLGYKPTRPISAETENGRFRVYHVDVYLSDAQAAIECVEVDRSQVYNSLYYYSSFFEIRDNDKDEETLSSGDLEEIARTLNEYKYWEDGVCYPNNEISNLGSDYAYVSRPLSNEERDCLNELVLSQVNL